MRATEAETAILAVLWDRGPSTVREVHDALTRHGGKQTGYTTALKLLQIMTDKGLVRRDSSARSHVYEAAVERGTMQAAMVDDLARRAFAGSRSQLVLRALDDEAASPAELEAIRARLDALIAARGGSR